MSSNQHVQYRAPPLPRPQYLQPELQQRIAASWQQQSASTSSSSYPSDQSQAYPQWQQHFPSNSFPSSNNSPETLDEDNQESKPLVKKGGRTSAANSASATGKRKERIHYSCTECHRRKQKCDRQQPCGHCVARNVPDLCKTFRPGDDTTDVSARMKRLESLMDDGFRQLADRLDSITSQVAYQSQVQAENLSLHHHQQQQQQQQQQYHHHMNGNRGEGSSSGISRIPIDPPTGWGMGSHRRRSNGAAGEGGGDEINGDSDSENGVANDRLSPETGAFIGSASVGIKSVQTRMGLLNELPITVSNIYDPVKTQLPPSIDDAMREFGSNGPSSLLLDDLPSKESIQILLDHFFGEINWIRQPLPEKSLRHSFEVMLKSDPILTPQSVNLYGMMMAIFSISALSVDSNADPSIFPDGPRSRRSRARKWHTSSRRALFVSSVLGCNQLEHVVCLNLACRFLLLDKRICESWTLAASAVKASHAIGLHREPKCLGLGEKESELRRRVWSSIYFGDRVLCATLGRPTSIDDAVCDTLPPNDIDEESDAPPPSEHILSKFPPGTKPPTVWSHTTQRHHLAVLMGKIIAVFQNVHRHAHYSEILQIDKEICDFRSSLPSHFRSNLNASGDGIEESDKELDEAFPFLETHRFLIETEINFLRTTLHRPYLLRSSQGSRYLPSRAACIEAAHHDIVLRVSFVKCLKAKFAPKEVSLAYQVQIGHSKWFSSLLICGIALVLDPHSDQFPILKNHLQHYFDTVGLKLQKLRAEGEHLKDEMRERETNILKLFMKKADELAAQEPSSNNAATTNTTTSTTSDQTNGKGKKRENQGEDGRILKRGRPAKKGSHSSGPEDEGDHATAGLLLGLQQQASSPLSQPPHRHSVSSSSNNSITSPMISRSGLTEQSPASTNPSGSAEHAQDLFDAWYKAEFAAGGSVSDTFGHVEGMNGGNGLNAWLTQPQMIQTSTNTSLNPPFFGGQANNTSTSNNFTFSNGAFGGQNSLDYSTQNLVNENESNMFNSAFNNRAVPFENMNLQALQQQQQRQQPDYSPVIEQQTNDNSDGGEFWKTLIEKITN